MKQLFILSFLVSLFSIFDAYSSDKDIVEVAINKARDKVLKKSHLFYEYHGYGLMMFQNNISSSRSILLKIDMTDFEPIANILYDRKNGIDHRTGGVINVSLIKNIINNKFFENYTSYQKNHHVSDSIICYTYVKELDSLSLFVNIMDTTISKLFINKIDKSFFSTTINLSEVFYHENLPSVVKEYKTHRSYKKSGDTMNGRNLTKCQVWNLIEYTEEINHSSENIFDLGNLGIVIISELEYDQRLESYDFKTEPDFLMKNYAQNSISYSAKSENIDINNRDVTSFDFYFDLFEGSNKYQIYDEIDTMIYDNEQFYLSSSPHLNKYKLYNKFYKCFSLLFNQELNRLSAIDTFIVDREMHVTNTVDFFIEGSLKIKRIYDINNHILKKCILLDSTSYYINETTFTLDHVKNKLPTKISHINYQNIIDTRKKNFHTFSSRKKFESTEEKSIYFLTYNQCPPCFEMKKDLFSFLEENYINQEIIFINPINSYTEVPYKYRQINKQDLNEEELKFLSDYRFPTVLIVSNGEVLFYTEFYNQDLKSRLLEVLKK